MIYEVIRDVAKNVVSPNDMKVGEVYCIDNNNFMFFKANPFGHGSSELVYEFLDLKIH